MQPVMATLPAASNAGSGVFCEEAAHAGAAGVEAKMQADRSGRLSKERASARTVSGVALNDRGGGLATVGAA